MSTGGAEGEPMMDINTTPLIDVMLVLLIMFIITIPIQTHAVKLDLPQDQPNQNPPPIDPVKNKIVVTGAGQILWNGAAVNPVQLRQLRRRRRGPGDHEAREHHRDGLRRQRGLRQVLSEELCG
jgi:biopolymer transport protein ExbD